MLDLDFVWQAWYLVHLDVFLTIRFLAKPCVFQWILLPDDRESRLADRTGPGRSRAWFRLSSGLVPAWFRLASGWSRVTVAKKSTLESWDLDFVWQAWYSVHLELLSYRFPHWQGCSG